MGHKACLDVGAKTNCCNLYPAGMSLFMDLNRFYLSLSGHLEKYCQTTLFEKRKNETKSVIIDDCFKFPLSSL
jgi:hypothetical protein